MSASVMVVLPHRGSCWERRVMFSVSSAHLRARASIVSAERDTIGWCVVAAEAHQKGQIEWHHSSSPEGCCCLCSFCK